MNERAVLAAWRDALRDSALDTTAKAVGFVIATYWDSSGSGAFPAKATIARGASIGKRTADRAIDRLEAAGFLAIHRSGGRRSNRYRASLPNRVTSDTVNRATSDTVPTTNGVTDDIQPCHRDPSTVPPVTPESDHECVSTNAYPYSEYD